MATKSRTTLKTYFNTGDIPTQDNYVDLIDSQLNLEDTTIQIINSPFSSSGYISTKTDVTSSGVSGSGNLSMTGNAYIGGDITSSGHISASGIIYAATVTADSYSDIYINGHVTASGNISSSGDLIASNITSSGTISSSGAITAASLTGVLQTAAQPEITEIGTIGTGVWQGTAVANAYLDADTAHLTTNQSFTGEKTFTKTITASLGISASGTTTVETLNIGGTTVTSTAAELNYVDGVTSNLKETFNRVSYTGSSGVLTMTEVDGGSDSVDLGIGTSDSAVFGTLQLNELSSGDPQEMVWNTPLSIDATRTFRIQTEVPEIAAKQSSRTQTLNSSVFKPYSVVVATTSHTAGVIITGLGAGTLSFHFHCGYATCATADGAIINFAVLS